MRGSNQSADELHKLWPRIESLTSIATYHAAQQVIRVGLRFLLRTDSVEKLSK